MGGCILYASSLPLAIAGHPQEAVKQIEGYRKILLNPEKKLYYHIWDQDRAESMKGNFSGGLETDGPQLV